MDSLLLICFSVSMSAHRPSICGFDDDNNNNNINNNNINNNINNIINNNNNMRTATGSSIIQTWPSRTGRRQQG